MRFVFYAIFIIVALWLGDMLYFNGRYSNAVLLEVSDLLHDFNHAVHRWTHF